LKSDVLWSSPTCQNSFLLKIPGFDIVINLILIVVSCLAVARNLKHVRDNQFERDELKGLAASVIVIAGQWVIGTSFDTRIIYSPVGVIFESQMSAYYVCFFSFFMIWYRAHQYSKNLPPVIGPASVTHLTGTSEASTHSDAPNSPQPEAIAPKSNAYRHEIEALLSDPVGFDELEKFLAREFCSEELYFLHEVHNFRREIENYSEEHAVSKAKKIYNKYVLEESHLCVNISGAYRKTVHNAMKEEILTKEKMAKVFDGAFMEVITLLATDKFRRFKLQSKKSSTGNKETKVEVVATSAPVSPTASA